MSKKALLFINGEPPKTIPKLEKFDLIGCTDGAFHYLKKMNFLLQKLDFISGDFDSHTGEDEQVYHDKFVFTPDQDKTDFHKALEIIVEKGIEKVDVFGSSGREQDHFMGNLNAAYRFKNQLDLVFHDEYSTYFFAPKILVLEKTKGKMISLLPFPNAENIVTKGLNWELNNETLSLTGRIGTRNFAKENNVSISHQKGDVLVFVSKTKAELHSDFLSL